MVARGVTSHGRQGARHKSSSSSLGLADRNTRAAMPEHIGRHFGKQSEMLSICNNMILADQSLTTLNLVILIIQNMIGEEVKDVAEIY